MAVPNWPTSNSFPQAPQKGYTESIGVNVVRSSMDSGPAKQRFRGNKPHTLNLSFFLTQAQVADLETFIVNTLKGVRRFNFPHPRTGVVKEMRIVPQQDGEMYTLNYIGPGYYTASLIFEVLP
jgi:hypothetical protein